MNITKDTHNYHLDHSNSMTDICFLMIIFFLVAAVFINDEGLSLLLPTQESEAEKKLADSIIQVQVLADETIIIEDRNVAIEEIQNEIQQLLQKKIDNQQSSQDVKTITALLKIDSSVSYKSALTILSEIEQGGVEDFTISTFGDESFLIPISFEGRYTETDGNEN